MGVNNFGQSGDLKEIYEISEIDLNSIVDRIAKFILQLNFAAVVKLADTPDLGSGGEIRGGSSPSSRTIKL